MRTENTLTTLYRFLDLEPGLSLLTQLTYERTK